MGVPPGEGREERASRGTKSMPDAPLAPCAALRRSTSDALAAPALSLSCAGYPTARRPLQLPPHRRLRRQAPSLSCSEPESPHSPSFSPAPCRRPSWTLRRGWLL